MNTDGRYKILIFYFFIKITGAVTIAPVAAYLEYGIQYCMFIIYIPMRSINWICFFFNQGVKIMASDNL